MKDILLGMQRESLLLPPKLASMVARYIEAVNDGRDPVKLFRNGANLLNATFRRAADGDSEALSSLLRDRISAPALAIAAEIFSTAALSIEEERERIARSACRTRASRTS